MIEWRRLNVYGHLEPAEIAHVSMINLTWVSAGPALFSVGGRSMANVKRTGFGQGEENRQITEMRMKGNVDIFIQAGV